MPGGNLLGGRHDGLSAVSIQCFVGDASLFIICAAIEAKGHVLNKPFILRREVGGSRNGFRIAHFGH